MLLSTHPKNQKRKNEKKKKKKKKKRERETAVFLQQILAVAAMTFTTQDFCTCMYFCS
jgi:hypothetical protein